MISLANKILGATSKKTHLFFVGQAGFVVKNKNGALFAIDLYLSGDVDGQVLYSRFIASIQVLAVRDEEGRDVFIDRDNPGEPAVMSFAVPEYLYLLLMRAQMTGFGIHLVGRNSSYSDNAAPTVMVSEELETLIKNKTYIIQNECVDLTVCG